MSAVIGGDGDVRCGGRRQRLSRIRREVIIADRLSS
jgi:hypothetical protein